MRRDEMNILIVEDDQTISRLLAQALGDKGYQTQEIEDFSQILEVFESFDPHLVLMDVNLPYFNGYYWCSKIREKSKVPIIFISSVTDAMDQLMAMDLGADDYITKPIDLALTLAKIQSWLRRTYELSDRLTFSGVALRPDKAELSYQGQTVHLTYTELQIMTLLFDKSEAYASRTEILDYCWQNDQFIDDNTLAVNISRLRAKLKTIGLDNLIETKKKVGYRLNEMD